MTESAAREGGSRDWDDKAAGFSITVFFFFFQMCCLTDNLSLAQRRNFVINLTLTISAPDLTGSLGSFSWHLPVFVMCTSATMSLQEMECSFQGFCRSIWFLRRLSDEIRDMEAQEVIHHWQSWRPGKRLRIIGSTTLSGEKKNSEGKPAALSSSSLEPLCLYLLLHALQSITALCAMCSSGFVFLSCWFGFWWWKHNCPPFFSNVTFVFICVLLIHHPTTMRFICIFLMFITFFLANVDKIAARSPG